jgi:lycopene cyclase domain-containing protein
MKMIYSDITIGALIFAVFLDLYILRTQLLTKMVFWTSYAIIFPMQLITNWWLTSRNIVMYDPHVIIGRRLAGAPIEDLLFGFALIVSVMSLWVFTGKRSNKKN